MNGGFVSLIGRLKSNSDLMLAGLVVFIISLMILPLPTFIVDLLLATNLGLAVTLLMMSLYINSVLSFSTFPSMLLFTTLLRLSLNITTTRLILLQADAGEVIETFGEFVVGGNLIVGTVIFLMYSIDQDWQIPVLILLLAIGLCVWMMANLASPTAPARRKYLTYVASLAVSAPIFVFGLWQMGAFSHNELPWQQFSEEKLITLRKEGKPMLIDFTANWCAICKWNEAWSLNTKPRACSSISPEIGATPRTPNDQLSNAARDVIAKQMTAAQGNKLIDDGIAQVEAKLH